MATLSGDVEGIHAGLGPNHNSLEITELEQESEDLMEVIIGGDVESRFVGVVLHGHQSQDRSSIRWLLFCQFVDDLLQRFQVAGSDGGEQRLIGDEAQ